MSKLTKIVVVCGIAALTACHDYSRPGDRPLAKVGRQTLYLSEVEGLFPSEVSPSDSLKLLESYIDKWVKKELKVREAERHFSADEEEEIDRKVQDYRKALLTHKLEQYYIDTQLDTTVTDDQVKSYYEAHRDEFKMDNNIAKGVVVRLNAKYRAKDKLKALMASGTAESRLDLTDICLKNGFTLWEADTWQDGSDFVAQIDTPERVDQAKLLSGRVVQEYSSGDNLWFVYIRDARLRGQTMPLELAKTQENARRILLNSRRQDVLYNAEDSLLVRGIENKKVTIFPNENK